MKHGTGTHPCLPMAWRHHQPTWELQLYPAPCNHSVIMPHPVAFLFSNLLAVFHIRWIIQQQTVCLFLTAAATMLHAHRVPSKACWKHYLLNSSLPRSATEDEVPSVKWEVRLSTALWHGPSKTEQQNGGRSPSSTALHNFSTPLSYFAAI